jgi:hypothetical protein
MRIVETFKNIWKIEELRTRILWTLGLVAIYRLGCFIVLQGIDASLLDALDGTEPEFEVGIHGVFHHHLHAAATQCLADFFHHEGIGGGAGAEPHGLDAVLEAQFHMFRPV